MDADRRERDGGGERDRGAVAIAASDRTRVYVEYVAAREMGEGVF